MICCKSLRLAAVNGCCQGLCHRGKTSKPWRDTSSTVSYIAFVSRRRLFRWTICNLFYFRDRNLKVSLFFSVELTQNWLIKIVSSGYMVYHTFIFIASVKPWFYFWLILFLIEWHRHIFFNRLFLLLRHDDGWVELHINDNSFLFLFFKGLINGNRLLYRSSSCGGHSLRLLHRDCQFGLVLILLWFLC